MAQIELKGLSKAFRETIALHPLDLSIEDGCFMVIVGPSGCGKTTLLNLIAGLEMPSGGDILFDGKSVSDLSPKSRDVAFVFQNYALYPHKTVFENIAFPLIMAKTDKRQISIRVNETAELLGINSLLKRKPKELSGGQRQRVALGRAIVRKPKIFLLDEPLSNLDARLRVQMRSELKKIHRQLKTTFIYVTHDQTEAMSLADSIAVLNEGRILQTAPPEDIYKHPANTFVASFIGSPGMNFIKGIIDSPNGTVNILGRTYQIPQKTPISYNEVLVGLRPEHFDIVDNSLREGLEAVVEVTEVLGSEIIYEVGVFGKTLIIKSTSDFIAKMGDTIYIKPVIEKAVYFNVSSGKNLFPLHFS